MPEGRSVADAGGLPAALAPEVGVYLQPTALVGGEAARALNAAGSARALAGGPLAFTACLVTLRAPEGIGAVVAALPDIEAWAGGLAEGAGARVLSRLDLLAAPRFQSGGAAHDRPLLMGIVNATPDSFSDGGDFSDPDAAIDHALRLAAEGADIVDIGGESTRPGAEPVELSVELERVVPLLDALSGADLLGGALLSIDTRRAAVMEAALERGVRMINDVSALTRDPRSLEVAAGSDALVALMHMQGEPATMNRAPRYDDVVLDVFDYLEARVEACVAAGIERRRLIVDPGIGFGKRSSHNRAVLRALTLYHGLGCPLLVGLSRKGLTGPSDAERAPKDRLPGSLAAAAWALDHGVHILRVHEVAETRQVLDLWERLAAPAASAD